MKIVNILGGLGNQMFQYALAIALQSKHPEKIIKIDISGFKGYPLHNGYELQRIFSTALPFADIKDQISLFYPLRNYKMWQLGIKFLPKRNTVIYENEDMKYNFEIIETKKSSYYLGYWQTEKYFKNIRPRILQAFSFPEIPNNSPNSYISNLISNHNAIAIHVRRGDYVKIGNTQGICSLEYYKNAIEYIKTKTNPEIFLIFSDDIDWCKKELSQYLGNITTTYVDWNRKENSFRDMQLMSLCKHNIIANSSFSWWGAWLNQNPDKIVVAPSRWMNSGGWVDIIPEGWHTI